MLLFDRFKYSNLSALKLVSPSRAVLKQIEKRHTLILDGCLSYIVY